MARIWGKRFWGKRVWGERTLSFADTAAAAIAGNLEYFLRRYEEAVAKRNVTDQSMLVAYALRGSPEVCAWGRDRPVAELMMARDGAMLKLCVKRVLEQGCIQRLRILLETPGVCDRVMEHAAVSVRHLKLVGRNAPPDVFCREVCLARGGAALHRAKKHKTLRWMTERFKLSASDLASVGLGSDERSRGGAHDDLAVGLRKAAHGDGEDDHDDEDEERGHHESEDGGEEAVGHEGDERINGGGDGGPF